MGKLRQSAQNIAWIMENNLSTVDTVFKTLLLHIRKELKIHMSLISVLPCVPHDQSLSPAWPAHPLSRTSVLSVHRSSI